MFNKDKKIKDENRVLEQKNGLNYVLLILTIFSVFMFSQYKYNHKSNYEKLTATEENSIINMGKALQNDMAIDSQRLMIFSKNNYIKQFLLEDDIESKKFLEDMFLSYVRELDSYDQIRIINADGMEVLRVERDSNNEAVVLAKEQLQDKSDRYYFKALMNNHSGQLYISLFDLNIEHEKIEIPHKPMIRVGKSIVTDYGKVLGMIIINIRGQALLDDIDEKNIEQKRDVFMLDESGYYLFVKENDKAFSFMFPEEKQVGFFTEYEEVWQKIKSGETDVVTEEASYFARKVQYLNTAKYRFNDRYVYLVTRLSKEVIKSNDKQITETVIFAVIIFVPMIAFFGWSFGVNKVREKVYKEKLEENANVDSLTKLYNHRMTIMYLTELVNVSKRKSDELALLFIDINNLKVVNDTLGHKMGDTMIIAAADSLTSSVRKTDFVARLGGDEFLVILPKCSEEEANEIMNRALEKFENRGLEEVNSKWIMSYGYAQLQEGESVNDLMQRADKRMYENKKITKGLTADH